jgi:hypothetical protein
MWEGAGFSATNDRGARQTDLECNFDAFAEVVRIRRCVPPITRNPFPLT